MCRCASYLRSRLQDRYLTIGLHVKEEEEREGLDTAAQFTRCVSSSNFVAEHADAKPPPISVMIPR